MARRQKASVEAKGKCPWQNVALQIWEASVRKAKIALWVLPTLPPHSHFMTQEGEGGLVHAVTGSICAMADCCLRCWFPVRLLAGSVGRLWHCRFGECWLPVTLLAGLYWFACDIAGVVMVGCQWHCWLVYIGCLWHCRCGNGWLLVTLLAGLFWLPVTLQVW